MIKVLHYIPGFLYGGIESMYLGWFSHLDKDTVRFDLLIRTQDDDASALVKYRELGGTYYRLPRIQNIIAFRKGVSTFFKQHHDYDILHTISACDPFILSMAKKYGIKRIILHSHTALSDGSMRNKFLALYGCIEKKLYVDWAFACSELAAKWMFGGMTFKDKPVFIIRNAIDCERYVFNEEIRRTMRNQLGLNRKTVIGHIGRLTYPKNQFFLLDIFRSFKNLCANAVLMVVGDGPDDSKLREHAKRLGITNSVLFLGVRSDIPELLQAMDLFLLPSRYEGLPVTEIEAQAAGLPCLVSDKITKESEVTDLVCRLSIEQSPEEWSKKMVTLLCKNKRFSPIQSLKDGGFDIHTETQRLTALYAAVLDDRKETL